MIETIGSIETIDSIETIGSIETIDSIETIGSIETIDSIETIGVDYMEKLEQRKGQLVTDKAKKPDGSRYFLDGNILTPTEVSPAKN